MRPPVKTEVTNKGGSKAHSGMLPSVASGVRKVTGKVFLAEKSEREYMWQIPGGTRLTGSCSIFNYCVNCRAVYWGGSIDPQQENDPLVI